MRIALVGATIDEARTVMVEGVSGVLSVARLQRHRVKWEPSLGRLTWPGGSVAKLFSGDNADGLRGPEHHFAWCDELAKWRQAEGGVGQFADGTSSGDAAAGAGDDDAAAAAAARADQAATRWTVDTGGRTSDNINLPDSFVDAMMSDLWRDAARAGRSWTAS